jgi:hypothetical protein
MSIMAHQWPSDGNHGSSVVVMPIRLPLMSHDCHLMATDAHPIAAESGT